MILDKSRSLSEPQFSILKNRNMYLSQSCSEEQVKKHTQSPEQVAWNTVKALRDLYGGFAADINDHQ